MTTPSRHLPRAPLKELVSIYSFTSYRDYLAALYAEGKKRYYRFSYRDFAEAVGGVSAGTLRLIIKGQRGMMPAHARKLGEHLGLSPRQLDYFLLMVSYERSGDSKERHEIYLQLSRLRMHGASARLEAHQYRYLSEWYTVVIRELVKNKPLDGLDYTCLAQQVKPPITPAQARKSVEILLELELLQRDSEGVARVTNNFLQTPREVHSLAARAFHAAMISLGGESIERVPSQERALAAMTLYLSPQAFDKVRDVMQQAQAQILELLKEDRDATRVYQLNYQLFPVSEFEHAQQSEVSDAGLGD
jgi:uncharacterized protein (TIGR02147 family)